MQFLGVEVLLKLGNEGLEVSLQLQTSLRSQGMGKREAHTSQPFSIPPYNACTRTLWPCTRPTLTYRSAIKGLGGKQVGQLGRQGLHEQVVLVVLLAGPRLQQASP